MRKYFLLIAASVIVLDRLAKWAVARYSRCTTASPSFPDCFTSPMSRTGSGVWPVRRFAFPWKIAALVGFSLVALIIVSVLLWKNSHAMTTTTIGLSLILGGATGNLWDRMVFGRVVDFLHFYIGSYSWPDFNVADSAIVVGAVLLVSEILASLRRSG